MHKLSIKFLVAIILSVYWTPGSVHAASNILIMAEDSAPQTVLRNEQLSQKVLAGVTEGLLAADVNIYDETAITYEAYVQGRSRRSNEELIDIAASIRKPKIDLVVFLTVDRFVKPGKYFDRASLSLSGRVLNVQSGKMLGTTNHKPKPWSLKKGCAADKACIEEALNREPHKVGRAIAMKLIDIIGR